MIERATVRSVCLCWLLLVTHQKHYFTARDFADSIWSQKVDAGQVEVKGSTYELELKPGAQANWVFIPMKPGTYSLRCVTPGHADVGMTGTPSAIERKHLIISLEN